MLVFQARDEGRFEMDDLDRPQARGPEAQAVGLGHLGEGEQRGLQPGVVGVDDVVHDVDHQGDHGKVHEGRFDIVPRQKVAQGVDGAVERIGCFRPYPGIEPAHPGVGEELFGLDVEVSLGQLRVGDGQIGQGQADPRLFFIGDLAQEVFHAGRDLGRDLFIPGGVRTDIMGRPVLPEDRRVIVQSPADLVRDKDKHQDQGHRPYPALEPAFERLLPFLGGLGPGPEYVFFNVHPFPFAVSMPINIQSGH